MVQKWRRAFAQKRAKLVQVFNTQCMSLYGSRMDYIWINYKKLYFYMLKNRRSL
jgi:hypothetical protein